MAEKYYIFVSSSDQYSDLWDPFFEFFKKFWPEYAGKIYLNTQEKAYRFDGLDIIATQVGKGMPFGKTFRFGLDKVPGDNVLLVMIDYFFMAPVKATQTNFLYDIFFAEKVDTLRLKHHPFKDMRARDDGLLSVQVPQDNMFSFQVAFWKKDKLKKMVLDHENPWAAEWHGTKRANILKIKMLCVSLVEEPIVYLSEGALHKGKWVSPIIDFLNQQGFSIDYSKRGLFDPEKEKNVSFMGRMLSKFKRSPSALRSIAHSMWLRAQSNVSP